MENFHTIPSVKTLFLERNFSEANKKLMHFIFVFLHFVFYFGNYQLYK